MLVVAQVSLSLLLLMAGSLFVRSLGNLYAQDPGFQTHRIIAFSVDPTLNGYDTNKTKGIYRQLKERLDGLGHVEASALGMVRVLEDSNWTCTVAAQGSPGRPTQTVHVHANGIPIEVDDGHTVAVRIHLNMELAPGIELAPTDKPRVGNDFLESDLQCFALGHTLVLLPAVNGPLVLFFCARAEVVLEKDIHRFGLLPCPCRRNPHTQGVHPTGPRPVLVNVTAAIADK